MVNYNNLTEGTYLRYNDGELLQLGKMGNDGMYEAQIIGVDKGACFCTNISCPFYPQQLKELVEEGILSFTEI